MKRIFNPKFINRGKNNAREEGMDKEDGSTVIPFRIKLPKNISIRDIASSMLLKGTGMSKTIGEALMKVLREELRLFFKSVDLSGEIKKILSDTSVEFRIEVSFKNKKRKK